VRKRLHADLDAPPGPNPVFSRRWDLIAVVDTRSPERRHLVGKTLLELGAEQRKHPVDAMLDLAVEEELETAFEMCEINFERDAMAEIITSPYTIMGLSDGGAHVQFDSGVSYTTRLLGYWVREQKVMTLEAAVRGLTLVPAIAFEIPDRGLLQPGMAADITVFDPDTVAPLPSEIAHDFPNNGWRIRQRARGIEYTVVNGAVVMERGEPTGALPGRVLRNYRTVYRDDSRSPGR
jgi:N-acyl-D-aspartate/D-glutamate deacylase